MPLLIYDNYAKIEEKSLDALHGALNWLTVNDNTNLGFVSEKIQKIIPIENILILKE